jgi:hypothetical protein
MRPRRRSARNQRSRQAARRQTRRRRSSAAPDRRRRGWPCGGASPRASRCAGTTARRETRARCGAARRRGTACACARLADRRRARLANSKGSLVKSPHRILSIARCVARIRSSTCCAVVIALRMQTRATANGTDGKRTQHLALCDGWRRRAPARSASNAQALVDLGQHRRRHHRHPQRLEHGLESFCRAPARPSSSSTLTADLAARCEPSKLCSVEPPRSTPVGAALANAPITPQSAAAPRSRATCRSRPRTSSCSGLARGSYSSSR